MISTPSACPEDQCDPFQDALHAESHPQPEPMTWMDPLHWLRCVVTGGGGGRHRKDDCIDARTSSICIWAVSRQALGT